VVLRSLRFLLPFGVALLAGAVIVVRATLHASSSQSLLLPFAVAGGLLLLVIARQELTFLESEFWQRQREVARSHELAALEETNRRMDAFLGVVSHELRTPLASIRWSLQAIQRRVAETRVAAGAAESGLQTRQTALHELVTHAEGQAARLQGLIKDLLEEVRLEEGQLALRLQPADLRTLVQEVVEEQQALQPERTIQVYLPVDRTLLVEVDGQRIRQAVTNYLTNALAYSPPNTPVLVGVEPAEEQARFWVRDQGPGIPQEEQARVWERFYRVPGIAEQSGPAEGLGLGLYITRMLIERHQGQVGLTSTPGQGTTFWLTLPLAPQERPASGEAGAEAVPREECDRV
jgi:signal transduction histidine kinase